MGAVTGACKGVFIVVVVGSSVGILVGAFVGTFVGALVGQTNVFSFPGVPLSPPLKQSMNVVEVFQLAVSSPDATALILDTDAPGTKGNFRYGAYAFVSVDQSR
jgi:hypothetical protein